MRARLVHGHERASLVDDRQKAFGVKRKAHRTEKVSVAPAYGGIVRVGRRGRRRGERDHRTVVQRRYVIDTRSQGGFVILGNCTQTAPAPTRRRSSRRSPSCWKRPSTAWKACAT